MSYEKFNINIFSNFAFTLAIPAYKKINYLNKYQAYKLYTFDEQSEYLKTVINQICAIDNCALYDLYTEKHDDNRCHIHGVIYSVNSVTMERIQDGICSVIGIRSAKMFSRLFNYVPIYNAQGWQKYCLKDQDEEPNINLA